MRSATLVAAVAAAACLSGAASAETAAVDETKDCSALKQLGHLQDGKLYFRNRDDVWVQAARGAAEQNLLRSQGRKVELVYFMRRDTRTSGALNIRIRNEAYGVGRQTDTVHLRRAAIGDFCEGVRKTRRKLNRPVDVNAYVDYHDAAGSRPELREFHIAYRDSDGRCVRTDTVERRSEFQFGGLDGYDQKPAYRVARVEKIDRPSLLSRFTAHVLARTLPAAPARPDVDKRDFYYTWLVSDIVRYPSLPADGACVRIPLAAGPGVARTVVSVTDFDANGPGVEYLRDDWLFGWDHDGRR